MELEKSSIKVPNVSSLPVSVDGLNNLVQGASIQIMSQPEPEVTRLPQYRTLEVSRFQVPQTSLHVRGLQLVIFQLELSQVFYEHVEFYKTYLVPLV